MNLPLKILLGDSSYNISNNIYHKIKILKFFYNKTKIYFFIFIKCLLPNTISIGIE